MDSAWKQLCEPRLLADLGEVKSYALSTSVYVMEFAGHLTGEQVYRGFDACWRSPGFSRPYGVVAVLDETATYDRSVREFGGRSDLVPAAAVGVVTSRSIRGMVISAIGLAVRVQHGTLMATYPNFNAALQAVRSQVRAQQASE